MNVSKIAAGTVRPQLPLHMRSRFIAPPVPHYTCDDCGKQTTLPFVPRQGQAITCSECFKRRRQPTGRREPVRNLALTPPEDRMYKAGLSWRWKPKH